ncbi:hypothetical protein LINGRAHAP2_LOCUS3381 [Linum grandiflorum]
MAPNAPTAIGSSTNGSGGPPSERERTSTPSATAWSNPASMEPPGQPVLSQTLYIAMWANGAIPIAVPSACPKAFAFRTGFPAAVLEVCVPWPSSSVAYELSETRFRAPISLLLHLAS